MWERLVAEELFDQLRRLDGAKRRPAAVWGSGLPAEPKSDADFTMIEATPVNGVRGEPESEPSASDPTPESGEMPAAAASVAARADAIKRAIETGDVTAL